MRDGVVRLCEGADLVIYDTQFTPEEYAAQAALGPLAAPRTRSRSRAPRAPRASSLFHHAPERTDDQNDAMLAHHRKQTPDLDLVAAAEGMELDRRATGAQVMAGRPSGACAARSRRPGPETNRYGGNTSCVELRTRAGELFIIDIGHRRHAARPQADGRRVRQGRRRGARSSCRTRTGITSRASPSSRRCSCRATSSPCTGRGARRRCSRASSRGR